MTKHEQATDQEQNQMSDSAKSSNNRQINSERRRQAILAAARNCFEKEGYAGATVVRIAKEANVSHGLLY